MAKDPEEQSEYRDRDEWEDEIAEEEEEQAEKVTDPERPTCPRCGWHNTRLSHTRSMLDPILRRLSFRAYRCRTCGKRFRAIWRVPKV
jgi:hypothetical protein